MFADLSWMMDGDSIRVVANIFISFIGAGVLGLPYAFKIAGLLEGSLVMIGAAALSVKAMLILIDCKYAISDRKDDLNHQTKSLIDHEYNDEYNENDHDEQLVVEAGQKRPKGRRGALKSKMITYSDVGAAALGPSGRLIIDVSLLVSQVGFCCAYLIFITENFASFSTVSSMKSAEQSRYLLLLLPPLFGLTLVPDLRNLAIFSLLAQLSNLLAFAVVFWFDFEHLHLASQAHRREVSLSGLPFFFCVAIYCFEGAGMILSLEHSVPARLKKNFRSLFIYTLSAVTALYVSFGVSGYLSFGEETRDIITLNLPLSADSTVDFALLVKACLCFSLFFTYPIMLFPVNHLLEQKLATDDDGPKWLLPLVIRLFIVSSTGLVVLAVPRFADLMGLVGALCCTTLAFIMPGLCHYRIFHDRLSKGERSIDFTLVLTGVIGAIVGTWDAVNKITL